MGILGKLIETAVDVVTLPLDIVEDVVDIAQGEEPTAVKEKLEELVEDII